MTVEAQETPILEVRDLTTSFGTSRGGFKAVDGVSFSVRSRESIAIVGESGSGKSVTCLSMLGLVDAPGRIDSGTAVYHTRAGGTVDLIAAREPELRRLRGNEIAIIFQEPMTSLNPVLTVGEQIAEVVRHHQKKTRAEALAIARDMFREVGISDPDRRVHQYPHELSGGMRQRVAIAMALCCQPSLLIADEATTALDVTIQAQVLDFLNKLRQGSKEMSLIFITHNLGIVAETAERVIIMYAAQIVEDGPVRAVFKSPRHPYTRGLLNCIPHVDRGSRKSAKQRLTPIPGSIPSPEARLSGCTFAPRCDHARPVCRENAPVLEETPEGRRVRCLRWRELSL